MDIYPQDLGAEEVRIVQHSRDAGASERGSQDASLWRAVALGVATVVSLGAGFTFDNEWIGWGALVVFLGGSEAILLALRERSMGHSQGQEPLPILQKPLIASDVWENRGRVTDPLKQSFSDLVLAAINTPPPPDVEAQKSVREAIRALGKSIAGLPLLASDGTPDDPAAYQLRAEQLEAEVDAERDAVIAASLRRRADALHRQAETAARTNTLLRRNEALRQEIAGQIAALQTSLTALRVGGAQAVYELADVAANIQQVAIEASAITQARSEMGDIVTVAHRGVPPAVQQVRH